MYALGISGTRNAKTWLSYGTEIKSPSGAVRVAAVEHGYADRGHLALAGHANTRVTKLVYRKELRPMLTRGASAMDALFGEATGRGKVSS